MSWSPLFYCAVMGVAAILVDAQEVPTHSVTPTDVTTSPSDDPADTEKPEGNVTNASSEDGSRNVVLNVWEFARFQGPASRRPDPTTPPPAADPAADSPSIDTRSGMSSSPCFWAIVLCCAADIPHVREGCFEESNCPGAWIGNLCSEKLKAKVRKRLFRG